MNERDLPRNFGAPRRQYMRRVVFTPYIKGQGPSFTLTLWDHEYRQAWDTKREWTSYRLTMRQPGKRPVTLFEGTDFGSSPLHSVDGDEAVKSLMGFLTLKPGDTDEDYFKDYTSPQLDFCALHAEALEVEVLSRFGEDA